MWLWGLGGQRWLAHHLIRRSTAWNVNEFLLIAKLLSLMTDDANTIYIRTAYVWCVAVISGISPQSNSRCGTTSCALRVAINRPCTRPVCNTINRNPNRSHAFYYVFCVNALQKPNMESGGVTRYAHFSRHHEVFGIIQASCNRVVFCVCLSVCAFYMFFFLLLLYFIFF